MKPPRTQNLLAAVLVGALACLTSPAGRAAAPEEWPLVLVRGGGGGRGGGFRR